MRLTTGNPKRCTGLETYVARCAIGLLFLAAAVGKALAPVQLGAVVHDVIRSVQLVDAPVMLIALCLIALEGYLGAAFLLGVYGRRTIQLTVLLILLFITLLFWMWIHPPTAGCGCLGFFAAGIPVRSQVALGLVRNLGLLLCLHALCNSMSRLRGFHHVPTHSSKRGMRAFSLIEILVVSAVLAVILALTIPALSHSRQAARRVTELEQTRHVGIAVQIYGTDYRDAFPYFATPGDIRGPIILNGIDLGVPYFSGQARMYVNLLYPAYLSSKAGLDSDAPEGHGITGWPDGVFRTSVQCSYTAFSRPGYWIDLDAPLDESLLQPGLWSDVHFPSQKGLLLDLRAHNRYVISNRDATRLPWGVVFADGAARRVEGNLTIEWDTLARPTAMFNWPVLSTRMGLAGRDFVTRATNP